jgi:tRNA1(Val) A37 N6-methylase TrmN6
MRQSKLSDSSASSFTLDAFHRGAFHLIQPKRGHRAGVDAMILAAALPSSFSGTLCDLGAGAGAAGMAVAARCPQARATLIEVEALLADCARRSLALRENAAIAPRVTVVEADVTARRPAREKAGLADASFDFAILNPPFNVSADRRTPDPLKHSAHVMHDGLIEAWVRTAAALVRTGGGIALIARPQSIAEIVAAFNGRFGGAQILPVHPRAGEAAIRIVVRARRGSRAVLSLMPPLVLHGETGDGFTARADAVNNGRESLFGN